MVRRQRILRGLVLASYMLASIAASTLHDHSGHLHAHGQSHAGYPGDHDHDHHHGHSHAGCDHGHRHHVEDLAASEGRPKCDASPSFDVDPQGHSGDCDICRLLSHRSLAAAPADAILLCGSVRPLILRAVLPTSADPLSAYSSRAPPAAG